MLLKLPLSLVVLSALSLSRGAPTTTTASLSASSTSSSSSAGLTTTPVTTSTPSVTAALNATIPSQAPLPPPQAWCPSEVFCAGSLLQSIQVAAIFVDSKTFVDKPTNGTVNKTFSDFTALGNVSNITYQEIINFVDDDFKGEGLELSPVSLSNFTSTPSFLASIQDPIVKAWSQIVHTYWTQLIRNTNSSTLCDGTSCESTLIPLNHTFVVPGGRFREQYYWDSLWITYGLLKSELYDVVNSTLQNFMDELDTIGFIPNGGRIYYLNRSQPPMFCKMLYAYVTTTGDTSILDRALPLAEVELTWWSTNRSLPITSPYTNKTYTLYHYAASNTAPRPEGYLEDYLTANGSPSDVINPPLNETQKEDLYAELASGAESGNDYTARWMINPYLGNLTDQNPSLRTLNVRNTIPVDLNSILYNYHELLALLYDIHDGTRPATSGPAPPSNNGSITVGSMKSTSSSIATTRTTVHQPIITPNNATLSSRASSNSTNSTSPASRHRSSASTLRTAILDLFWDSSKLAFYDYNLTAGARGTFFAAAHFYPFWNHIIPDEVMGSVDNATKTFGSLILTLGRYNGTFPGSFLVTGLQWDAPNAWPPHQYIILEALRNLPSNLTQSPLPLINDTFAFIPPGQLGLTESQLPPQPLADGSGNAVGDVNMMNGTVVNGGNATTGVNGGLGQPGWSSVLERELANRYISSAFCSWYATGGSIPGLLQQLSPADLNATFSNVNSTGNMYEKFDFFDVDTSGFGGEYTVQAGFGWTNGVVLWMAAEYGGELNEPVCPPILINSTTTTTTTSAAKRYFVGSRRKRGEEVWR